MVGLLSIIAESGQGYHHILRSDSATVASDFAPCAIAASPASTRHYPVVIAITYETHSVWYFLLWSVVLARFVRDC